MLLNLSPGNRSGLGHNFGTEFDDELFILLLKSSGKGAIAGVLDGNRFNPQRLDIKGKPHSMTLELLGFGQKSTWSPAEWISGRVHREPEYRRIYSEHASPFSAAAESTSLPLNPHRQPCLNMYPDWLRSRPFPLVNVKFPILGRGVFRVSGCVMSWKSQSFLQKQVFSGLRLHKSVHDFPLRDNDDFLSGRGPPGGAIRVPRWRRIGADREG
jgi:hypothetical protein